ncbi:hypothetical protein BJV78DRAFT_57953 [Lactifluus subvellereus]|nr:hypothetical protein BJV78DRAFT_57953 [Lactifluus subvellereus]
MSSSLSLGFFFVRPIPLTSHRITSVEGGSSNNYQPLSTSVDPDEFSSHINRSSSSLPLLFHTKGDEDEETRERIPQRHASNPHVPVLDSMELSPSTSFHNRRLSGTMSLPAKEPPTEKIVEGRGVDLYRWTLHVDRLLDYGLLSLTLGRYRINV